MAGGAELQELVLDPEACAETLARLPARAGVAQLLDAAQGSLLIAQPANLRRWLAAQLGLGPPPRRPSRRPRLDLRAVARGVRFRTTRFSFEQRLAFERLMAEHVPAAKRRDLRPAGWLRLDFGERFPRLELTGFDADPATLFGPFRDRAAAARARDALNRQLGLRPCEVRFEPDPELPLGLGCLYAQMRSCAAPCLERTSQQEYAALARRAEASLAAGAARPEDAGWRGDCVSRASPLRALVAERGRGGAVALFPLRDGSVLDAAWIVTDADELPQVLSRLSWEAPGPAGRDWPWLASWLHSRRRGAYLVIDEAEAPEALAGRVRGALGIAG